MNKFDVFPNYWIVNTNDFSHMHDLEKFWADAAKLMGFEIENVSGDGAHAKVYAIKRIDKLLEPIKETNQPNSKKVLDDMRNKPVKVEETKFKQGQFLPSKGYIKR